MLRHTFGHQTWRVIRAGARTAGHWRVEHVDPDPVLAVLLVTSLGLGPRAGVAAGVFFDIPAQTLNNALLSFAAQSRLELIFSADMVRGLDAKALRGEMSAEEALDRLLRQTGLGYRFVDGGTVTLARTGEQGEAHRGNSTVLDTVEVLGNREPRPRGGGVGGEPWQGYRPARVATATRTETPVMEIPQSVQAFRRSLIDDQQSITLSEALINVSGVVPRHSLYMPATEGTLIRGFAAEQLVDGFTQYYNAGDRESVVNVERIEVLKGSNAVLYGGGSGSPVGGVVNLVSRLPQAEAFGEAGFRLGTEDFHQPYLDFNQPLGGGALFRLTGEYTETGSDVDVLETRRFNINPALTLRRGDTVLTVQGKVSRWRQPDYQGLPAVGTIAGGFRIPGRTFIGPRDIPDSTSDADAVWASLDHQVNARWAVSLKARYGRSRFDEKVQSLLGEHFSLAADVPAQPPSTWRLINAELFQEQEDISFLGNLSARFSLGPTENTVLLGADRSVLDDAGFVRSDLGASGLGIGSVDLAHPAFPLPYQEPAPRTRNQFMNNVTYGGYAQLQTTVLSRFHQLLSVRMGAVDIGYRKPESGVSARTDELRTLPRVGAVLDVTDEFSVFAGYGEGMRGQPYVNFVDTPMPELSRQIEAGVKLALRCGLSGQLAAFQIDRSRVAVTDGGDLLRRATASGSQQSRGFEVDLLFESDDALAILASYAHTQARFSDDLAGVPEGNRLPLVPENSGRLWVNYRFQQESLQGLSVGAGIYARSGAFLSNDNRFAAGGFHRFDAAIAYDTGRLKLAATVKNLTGEDYFLPYDYFDGRVASGEGIAVYVSGAVRY